VWANPMGRGVNIACGPRSDGSALGDKQIPCGNDGQKSNGKSFDFAQDDCVLPVGVGGGSGL